MGWDKEFAGGNRLWGETPSVLGVFVSSFWSTCPPASGKPLEVLDIGCGYGRDAVYLSRKLPVVILGIDSSQNAIDIAKKTALTERCENIQFRQLDFRRISGEQYDVVFVSNLYQILKPLEREELRKTISRALRAGGTLFLSTLSVSDPEHKGQGAPIPGEENSIDIGKYLHLCTREEMIHDFSFLDIRELEEHEYDEPRSTGKPHHHISWILRAKRPGA